MEMGLERTYHERLWKRAFIAFFCVCGLFLSQGVLLAGAEEIQSGSLLTPPWIPLTPGYVGDNYTFSGNYANGQITIWKTGWYYLTDNLTPSSTEYAIWVQANNSILNGDGKKILSSYWTGTGVLANNSNVTITNFQNISGFYTGVSLTGREGQVSHNSVTDNSGYGISTTGIQTNISENTGINNTEAGISATGINTTITENLLRNTTKYGIITRSFANVSDNIVENSGNHGISMWDDGIAMRNTVRANAVNGINVWDRAYIAENVALQNRGRGIKALNNASLQDNHVSRNTGDGIFAGRFATILDNYADHNRGFGIYIGDYAKISENYILYNQGYGLRSASNCNITQNFIHTNQLGGIIADNQANVSSNVLINNGGDGVFIANNGFILRNFVMNNSNNGINTFQNARIDNNLVLVNGASGIYPWSHANVTNNTIAGNTNGISIPEEYLFSTIYGNVIEDNTQYGLHMEQQGSTWYPEGDALVYNNFFANNVNLGGEADKTRYYWTNPKGTEQGENIVGGPFIAGNYWGNPNETGWSDLQPSTTTGYTTIPYQATPGKYDYYPLVGLAHVIHASADPWTIAYPSGNRSYDRGTDAKYLFQAKPGSRLENVTIDGEPVGPKADWTFPDISADHTLYTTGTPIPGQIQASFSMNITFGPAPLTVAFTNQSLGGPTSFEWYFGDKFTSNEQNPIHTYNTSGTYSVSLRASNDESAGSVIIRNAITVTDGIVPAPTPTFVPGEINTSFSGEPTTGYGPMPVQFSDLSTGNPTSWLWDFGDGNTSTGQNVTHLYLEKGTYSVRLTAQNSLSSGSQEKSGYITVQ